MTALRAVSYGGGVQSTALLVLAARGGRGVGGAPVTPLASLGEDAISVVGTGNGYGNGRGDGNGDGRGDGRGDGW